MIGYLLQVSLNNAIKSHNFKLNTVTILTQTIVDKNDMAFKNPNKPIGPFYTAMQSSNLKNEKNWVMINDAGRGYRRVVPSPEPIGIVEEKVLKYLYDKGFIIIACGGGGIPVYEDQEGNIIGIEAVIDKDHTAALLAKMLETNILLILTDVDKVALNYGKPNQKELDIITIDEAKKYLAEGYFPPGNMGPKIEACIRFVESGGEKAIITSLEHSMYALDGKSGTIIKS